MCQRSIFARSACRLAEEVQLQAEEEFMVEALKMIKQQRNCLQIERLHLESLRQQLMNPIHSEESEQVADAGSSKETSSSNSKPTELMSAVDMMNRGSNKQKDHDTIINDDMQCNNQELNLNPNATVTATSNTAYRYDYNSDDDGSSSDSSNGDDVMIDMNMLMNSTNDNH